MEFKPWGKTPRLFRDITITEKIDGTNSAIIVRHDGMVGAQSRNRLITPGKDTDNYGFAAWVAENDYELAELLGPGHHYGEWWGQGIARRYDMDRKVFSLFNTFRHGDIESESNGLLRVVPTLYEGPFSSEEVRAQGERLRKYGSVASPGYMNPEGVCVHHSASNQVYKYLLTNDELPKGLVA